MPFPKRRVICVETGEVYESIGEAARMTGLTRSGISQAISGQHKTAGKLHWRYKEGYDPAMKEEIVGQSSKRQRRVVCVETAETYESVKEAAEAVGLSHSAISLAINGQRETAGKLHWQYADVSEKDKED